MVLQIFNCRESLLEIKRVATESMWLVSVKEFKLEYYQIKTLLIFHAVRCQLFEFGTIRGQQTSQQNNNFFSIRRKHLELIYGICSAPADVLKTRCDLYRVKKWSEAARAALRRYVSQSKQMYKCLGRYYRYQKMNQYSQTRNPVLI